MELSSLLEQTPYLFFVVITAKLSLNTQTNSTEVFGSAFYKKRRKVFGEPFYKKARNPKLFTKKGQNTLSQQQGAITVGEESEVVCQGVVVYLAPSVAHEGRHQQ